MGTLESIPALHEEKRTWPFLQEAIREGLFLSIDLFFAEMLLKSQKEVHEEEAVFLCFLIAASRMGHLCVHITEEKILPSPAILAEKMSSMDVLSKMILKGSQTISFALIEAFDEEKEKFPFKPLCKRGSDYYLQKNWLFETHFSQHLHRLLSFAPKIKIKPEALSAVLNEEQKQAVTMALSHSISLITGGPGTGKTFTAIEIVRSFLEALHPEERQHCSIVLAAPTGKAASHLEKNLRSQLHELPRLQCGTLHSLLGIRSSEDFYQEARHLFADLLIVDEASMLDARLFSYLLASLPEGSRVIFMGDKDQLPPVDCGSLFADLIEFSLQGCFLACTELKKCLRSERKEILSFAEAINQGEASEVQKQLHKQEGVALKRIDLGLEKGVIKKAHEALWQRSKEYFPKPSFHREEPEALLKKLDEFRILSCVRKGPFGVDAINHMILERGMEAAEPGSYVTSPILITRNDYSLELFNGEVGVLIRKRKKGSDRYFDKEDVAYFYDKGATGALRKIPALILPSFEYAYCLSVHKSQGSEYEKVLILVPEGSESFGKEVLYTAVTRAKKSVEIDGKEEVIALAVQRSSRKISGLHARLRQKGEKHHEEKLSQ